ncbi:MAG TPA: ABC transporter ATP-binding protein, partial [Solirubrobacterales bacterium]|nr:ABC transporter ATP-binding protein [Solirubrobacterales bacterium]
GGFFGLLGPNGAGKTTLISAVCNLIRPTAGEALVFGHPHDSMAARRLVGLAEQDVNLDRFLDVEETLLYHGGYYGMSRAHARRRAAEMMDVFDLRGKARTRAPKLSGGMRRRLLLARGLVHEPRLVLLDEPTVGLDPQIRTELWTLIGALKERGTTILMSTHYIEEAERLADEVAVMHQGKVISRGRPSELIAEHAGRQTAEVYAPPQRLAELRAELEAAGLRVRPAGPAIAIVGSERAENGDVPEEAVMRAATLEDVFVLLTGEEAE